MGLTALVTGASRGIGAAIAKALAGEGYDLILTCSSSVDELEKAAEEIRNSYRVDCFVYRCDAGSPADVEELFSHISGLDLLVNNAGISWVGLLQDMTYEEWNRVISVNLSSCFYTVKKAIPLFLEKQNGRIINISSVWGNVGASAETAYSASKGGINSFTKALAKELAPSGIAVNAIACGCVDTVMNGHLSAEDKEILGEEIPVGRFASPDEIANVLIQLIHATPYLTGQIITVDGGWT